MTTIRQERVSELLYEELSILIANELSDPQLSFIDVTDVQVSRDLRSARVYVYHQDKEIPRRNILRGLKRATPFLRKQLAIRCRLRVVPELLFYYDDTPEQAARVDQLLEKIAEEQKRQPQDDLAAGSETTALDVDE
jgi:ribosome-binding factor A